MATYEDRGQHAPKQVSTIGASLSDKLDDPARDSNHKATAREGMLLFTNNKSAAKTRYKRARHANALIAASVMPNPDIARNLLGVCIDNVGDSKLAKTNPNSVGAVGAVVGGAVTIKCHVYENIRVGDVIGVNPAQDRKFQSSWHGLEGYKAATVRAFDDPSVSGSGTAYQGYSPDKPVKGGKTQAPDDDQPAGINTSASFGTPSHEVIAAVALDLGQPVVTNVGASVEFANNLVVNGEVREVTAEAAAEKFVAALAGTGGPVGDHVAAAVTPFAAKLNTPVVDAIKTNVRGAAELVATAAAFGAAITSAEHVGLRSHFGDHINELKAVLAHEMGHVDAGTSGGS